MSSVQKDEVLPPNTVCTASYDFQGEGPNDLSFVAGEKITIVNPSSQMFWYVARNRRDETGLVPITFLKVDDSPPARPPKQLRRNSPVTLHPQTVFQNLSEIESPPARPPKPFRRNSPSTLFPLKPAHKTSRSISETSETIEKALPIISSPKFKPQESKSLPRNSKFISKCNSDSDSKIDKRPPMPLPHELSTSPGYSSNSKSPFNPQLSPSFIPKGKYPTIHSFRNESGWFSPAVDAVLCRKINISLHVLKRTTSGLFFFQHKFERQKQYIGKSLSLYNDLTLLFSRLYEKPTENLNSLEKELRFYSSDAKDWNVRMWQYPPDILDLECAIMIVQQRCLYPYGLNKELVISSKKDWTTFCEWYTEHRQKQKTKNS